MKGKHKKTIPKTRGHRVERKPYVPIRKYTSTQQHGEWKAGDKKECSEDQKWEGNESSPSSERREDQEECKEALPSRNTENTEKPVHPGPVQTLFEMYPEAADDTTSEKGCIESEELPPW